MLQTKVYLSLKAKLKTYASGNLWCVCWPSLNLKTSKAMMNVIQLNSIKLIEECLKRESNSFEKYGTPGKTAKFKDGWIRPFRKRPTNLVKNRLLKLNKMSWRPKFKWSIAAKGITAWRMKLLFNLWNLVPTGPSIRTDQKLNESSPRSLACSTRKYGKFENCDLDINISSTF